MSTRRLLLYKTGKTDPSIVTATGDYEAWFSRVLGETARFEVHLAFERPHHPLRGYDGMIITGSPMSLVEPDPWMHDAAGLVRDAYAQGLPTLGVCFGHQLVGYAFGAAVRKHPSGWEVGTSRIHLRDAGRTDRLFDGVAPKFWANQSHRDEVIALPENVTCLAENAHSQAQAIAVGEHVRGVQFHPEISGHVIKHILQFRRQRLYADAAACGACIDVEERIATASDTPEAERVLANFVTHFVGHA